ncbi:MAG: hypothetical protein ACXWZ2_14320, partial [Mycobacterium sp.]
SPPVPAGQPVHSSRARLRAVWVNSCRSPPRPGLSGAAALAHHLLQSWGQGVGEVEHDLDGCRVSGPVGVSLAEAVSGGAGLDNLRDRLRGGRMAVPANDSG